MFEVYGVMCFLVICGTSCVRPTHANQKGIKIDNFVLHTYWISVISLNIYLIILILKIVVEYHQENIN